MQQVYSDGEKEYDVNKLIRLSRTLPILRMRVCQLEKLLDEDVWGYPADNGLRVRIVPREVMLTRKPADHWNRIMNIDIMYPILMHRGFVVDGMHRLAYRSLMCYQWIHFRRIPGSMMEATRIR